MHTPSIIITLVSPKPLNFTPNIELFFTSFKLLMQGLHLELNSIPFITTVIYR